MTSTPSIDLAGIIHTASALVAEHGLEDVMAKGGAMGGLLARENGAGARAWTLAQAAEAQGLTTLEGMAAYALHHGALVAWSMQATDQRLAELAEHQLELVT